jgi:hypothetical protein
METLPSRERIVVRLYADAAHAVRAANALRDAGVPPDVISVLSRSSAEADGIEHATGASDDLEDAAVRHHRLADFIDWLGRVESVVVPGFGAVLGTGDLWQDVARGGQHRGSITGVLVGLGLDVDQASRFEESVAHGELLLAVHTADIDTSAEQIEAILDSAVP